MSGTNSYFWFFLEKYWGGEGEGITGKGWAEVIGGRERGKEEERGHWFNDWVKY